MLKLQPGNWAEWAAAAAGIVTAVFAVLIYRQRPRGASLSIRYERQFLRMYEGKIPIHSERFIVTNLGPDPAQVKSIEVLGEPRHLPGPLGIENLHLLKDEEHRMLAFTDEASPHTVQVRMIWVDSQGEQSRDQTVNLF